MKKILLGVTAMLIAAGPARAQTSPFYPSFADLVEKLSPSVVNISTTQKPENLEGGDIISLKNLPAGDGQISPIGQEHYALGSGFLVDENGYILTNSHVIDRASSINVILADNSQHQATVIGTDDKTDLALIKIDTDKKLVPVRLGDSDKIRVGDWILAIGNPFGLGGSVTAGIVSAKSRDIESGPYDNYIQTDASINQGNSGGPMFNLNGDVIGINTAIFSTTGGNMGVSFAIPVNNAKFVIKELKNSGKVNRGWIGVRVQPQMTEAEPTTNVPAGILVSSVSENSPAAQTGVQAGDIITSLNGGKVESAQVFSRLVSESPVNSSIILDIWRNGQTQTLNISVKEMPLGTNETPVAQTTEETAPATPDAEKDAKTPENPTTTDSSAEEKPVVQNTAEELKVEEIAPDIAAANITEKSSYTIPGSGMIVRNITIQDLNEMDMEADTMGVIVVSTLPNSEAAVKGIRPGLIITKINNRNIYNTDSTKSAVYDKAPNDLYTFTLLDGKNINTVTIKMKVQ